MSTQPSSPLPGTASFAMPFDQSSDMPADAVLPEQACFHCGLPLPRDAHWSVKIGDAVRPMCCPGCEAVAQAIVANGLADYYQTRTVFSAKPDAAELVPAELKLYDMPEAARQFDADAQSCEATLSVEGIRCAACVWLIERRLACVPGLQKASMNVATERLQLRWDKERCRPSDVLQALRNIGYVAYPYDPVRQGEQLRRASKILGRQLFIAGLSMMQVMMYAVPAYLAHDGTLETDMAALLRWASLLLTLPAIVYSARPFFAGAWINLKNFSLGMDVPVALGIGAAFIASLIATVRGQGEVYFDSVTMFIFLLLCSRYLELLARRKAASALERLQHALPASATLLPDYPHSHIGETVPAARLAEGDLILIKPGEAIAADCVIVEGSTAIDLSLLSGESQPQRRQAGEVLAGGAVNASRAVVARVTKPAGDSTLSALIRLIERAGAGKPQIALWADKVAAWFVAALLIFTVVVFLAWNRFDPAHAWEVAIAVLVVSCPCALSLAMPTALAAATDNLVRQGVLVVQPHVLETLHRATHVIFDKTGTLTDGQPGVRQTSILGETSRERCLQLAAALEESSAHPLARALLAEARTCLRQSGATPDAAEELRAIEPIETAGQGVEAKIHGKSYRIGTREFVAQLSGTCPDAYENAQAEGMTSVYLGTENAWMARFDLADALRGDAREVVRKFQRAGKTVMLLSGDQNAVTQRVAEELGIEKARGACLPEQKLALVQQLQSEGAVVAMVGDGINDAAVLRAADVSFAMGSGAALAQAHADTVLLSGRLSSVWQTAQLASKTMAVVRQNLAWATLYNLIAIPAAAMGLLNPWLSGVGMSVSSAVVVVNALRLRRMSRDVAAAGDRPHTAARFAWGRG